MITTNSFESLEDVIALLLAIQKFRIDDKLPFNTVDYMEIDAAIEFLSSLISTTGKALRLRDMVENLANIVIQTSNRPLAFVIDESRYALDCLDYVHELVINGNEAAEQSVQRTPGTSVVACPFCGEVEYCIHRDH